MTGEVAERRFRDVVIPHLDAAYALAKWLSGSGADAEDIVQEAALRALAALEATIPLKPRAWWLAIVRNTALTWLARKRPGALAFVGDLDDVDDVADPRARRRIRAHRAPGGRARPKQRSPACPPLCARLWC